MDKTMTLKQVCS